MFEPGQSVLCVKDDLPWTDLATGEEFDGPRRGQICLVRRVYRSIGFPNFYGLVLAGWGDSGWCSSQFAPIKKTETDISVFTTMLNKYPAARPMKPVEA